MHTLHLHTPGQKVDPGFLELSCTGSGKDELQTSFLFDQTVHGFKQFGYLLNLVDHHGLFFRMTIHKFTNSLRTRAVSAKNIGKEQVQIKGIGKALLYKGRFSGT
jgi:hypothetical protein